MSEPRSSERDRLLSYSEIVIFWLPLGIMSVMIAAEQPAFTAIIARLPNAETNLAAFGVVFALSLVIESPIIQMLAAATAIANNAADYRMLLRFMHLLGGVLTGIHLLVGLTPLYDLIVTGLLNVPPGVTKTSRLPFILMAPITMAVGYRRLWQGMLIRHGKTWVVPITMISRLGLIAAVLAIGYGSGRVPGATLAAIAWVSGVIIAGITAGVLNRILVVRTLREPEEGDRSYSWRALLHFYAPLSLTTIVFLLAQPVLTFGISRGIAPTRSLAVWPVINAFTFLFVSIALSHQEAAIALLNRSPGSLRRVSRFTHVLAASLTGLMLLASITPLGRWWFSVISGLDDSLLPLTTAPLLILSLVPALIAYKAWYRARCIMANRTTILAQGVIVYTVVLFLNAFAGSAFLQIAGATVATLALTVAQGVEIGFLFARKSGALSASHTLT